MSKGTYLKYSKKELAWIAERAHLPRRDLHQAFVDRFGRGDLTVDNIKALCTRKGWATGRTGQFDKGSVPANKGQKMPYNANSARTQFKKGAPRGGVAAEKYKPVGFERVNREGYLERKIHDGMPLQSRWRAVHLLNWERLNGPIPKGMVLKCLGEKTNTDLSNWELIPRALLPRLNGKFGRDYDNAPAELKPTIMAITKLEHLARERRK